MEDFGWVMPYVARAIEFLGLHAWEWSIRHESGVQARHGARERAIDAECDADWPYLTASITIDSAVWVGRFREPSAGAKLMLCHEVLHILLAQTSHAMNEIVNVYFPPGDGVPSDKATAFTLYRNHEEHLIVRLSRQLYEALERDEELERLRAEVAELRADDPPPRNQSDSAPTAEAGVSVHDRYGTGPDQPG